MKFSVPAAQLIDTLIPYTYHAAQHKNQPILSTPFFRSYPTFIIWQVCLLKNTTLSTNFDGKFKLSIFCLRVFLWKALKLLEWCQRRHSFLSISFHLFLINSTHSQHMCYIIFSFYLLVAQFDCKFILYPKVLTGQRDRRWRALLQYQNFNFLFYLGWSGCFTQRKHNIMKVVLS